jgi:hypothetical protein
MRDSYSERTAAERRILTTAHVERIAGRRTASIKAGKTGGDRFGPTRATHGKQ